MNVLQNAPHEQKQNESVEHDSTAISLVDGINGRLNYRGIDICELSSHGTFEEVVFLLLVGRLPNKKELSIFEWSLKNARKVNEKLVRIISECPQSSNPLSILQMGVSVLGCLDRKYDEEERTENHLDVLIRIIAQTPIILAAAYRFSKGFRFIEPRYDLGFVDNLFYMLFGKMPTKLQSRCLETALIIQMDHGFNSSTVTARSVARTNAHFYSVVSASIGALNGGLHGNASEKVINMIREALAYESVEKFTNDLLSSGGKIMGMGHRIYKVADPRALIFKDLFLKIVPKPPLDDDYFVLEKIEMEARKFFEVKMKKVFVNLDFWSGRFYMSLGIEPKLFSSIFCIARTVGWCAHSLELRLGHKSLVPDYSYIGKLNQPYIHIDQR